MVHKDSLNVATQTIINLHLRMHTFKGYLNAKCQFPVPMHNEQADERLGGCDLGLETVIFQPMMKYM